MDHTDSQAFDPWQGAAYPLEEAIGPPAGAGAVDLALGYEAAVPWLQQPLWEEALRGEALAASDR